MGIILLEKEDLANYYVSDYFFQRMLYKYQKIFPIERSTELASLVGDLMADGHVQGEGKWRIDYTSKSKKELQRFGKVVYDLFGVKGKIRPCTTNKFSKTFNYGVNCKPIALILHLSGAPTGAKVLKAFKIPDWILNDKEFFRIFVYRLFCCEGTVDYSKTPFIEMNMHKDTRIMQDGFAFFNSLKDGLFNHFGIISNSIFTGSRSFRKDGIITIALRLKIKRKVEISKFIEEIGFPKEGHKRDKILAVLNGNI